MRELHEATLIIGLFAVAAGRRKRRTLLGWLRLGGDERESADAAEQWTMMIDDGGRAVERWQTLRRPRSLEV